MYERCWYKVHFLNWSTRRKTCELRVQLRVEHVVGVWSLYNCRSRSLDHDSRRWSNANDWNGSSALTDVCDAANEDATIGARNVCMDMRASGSVTNLRLEVLFCSGHDASIEQCGVGIEIEQPGNSFVRFEVSFVTKRILYEYGSMLTRLFVVYFSRLEVNVGPQNRQRSHTPLRYSCQTTRRK